jgi:hypothetical protein
MDIPLTISVSTAFAAVVISPLTSYLVARIQFRASVLSANRQQWVNTLREQIAAFVSEAHAIMFEAAHQCETDDYAAQRRRYVNLNLLETKINLLINHQEEDHRQLVSTLASISSALVKSHGRDQEGVMGVIAGITPLSQRILKREWVRIRSGR